MALVVWTARISTKDPDAVDVTRKTGNPVFAPSWKILKPILAHRRIGQEVSNEEWKEYARRYFEEMRVSSRENPVAWKELMARERVVLTCYCVEPTRCHRTLLGRLLEKLGAKFAGELVEYDESQAELFKLAMNLPDDD
jgi:uncharacterized protein YeaO (DUF488 family)